MFRFFMLMPILLLGLSVVSLAQTKGNTAKMKKSTELSPGGCLYITQFGIPLRKESMGLGRLPDGPAIDEYADFRMASVSKQFTAAAIYTLQQDGKLRVETTIGEIFPALRGAPRNITIAQLLNHSSGIWDYEELVPKDQAAQLSDADVLNLILPVEKTYFEPGKQFRYSNTAYCLLSLIVEHYSGMSYPAYVATHIFEPLGMDNSLVYYPQDSIPHRVYGYHPEGEGFVFADQSLTSATKGDGGVYTNAMDYHKWAAYLNGLFMENDKAATLSAAQFPLTSTVDYSMGWFMGTTSKGERCFFHSGESTGFNNIVMLVPARGLVATFFTNRDDFYIADHFDHALEKLGVVVNGLEGQSLFKWLNTVYAHVYSQAQ